MPAYNPSICPQKKAAKHGTSCKPQQLMLQFAALLNLAKQGYAK
jgi:hypothetical protein